MATVIYTHLLYTDTFWCVTDSNVGFMFSIGNIWNTIAFVKPTYITFPTFKPGSSADISFHFKTYRDHGVFLENSDDQLRNFIRIELNSEQNSSLLLYSGILFNSASKYCIYFLLQPPITLPSYSWSGMGFSMLLWNPQYRSMTTSGTLFRLRSMWNWHGSRLTISPGLLNVFQVRPLSPWSLHILS